MLGFFLTTFITALSLLVVDLTVPGVVIASFATAMGAALAIGLINGSIKPIVRILSLPITVLTLGGFSLVINSFCFWFASLFVPGFVIHGFLGFILGPIVLSVVSTFLTGYAMNKGWDKKIEGVVNKLTQAKNEVIQPATKQEKLEALEAPENL